MTFTATLQTSPAAVGSLTNTVSADAPAGVTDTNSGNNQATDVDTITPQSDVSVTKTDGLTSIAAGELLEYTITVSSGGPSVINPVAVDDDLPAGLTATTWTCTASSGSSCAAGSGSGSIHSSVNLLVGGSATYTVTGTVSPSFRGTLSNTVTATLPGGATDPTPANNSATDVTTVVGETDLSVTKTDGRTSVIPGTSTTYTIVVSNAGPSTAIDAPVTDTFNAALTNATWTCSATTGSSCGAASGSGSIASTVTLAAGGSATYTLTGTVAASATGSLVNTASVALRVRQMIDPFLEQSPRPTRTHSHPART